MAEPRELLEIKQRISLLEARLEQLLDDLGAEPQKRPPPAGGESSSYREETGHGLQDGEDPIDAV